MSEEWVEHELDERGWKIRLVEVQEDDEGMYSHEVMVVERIEDGMHIHTSYSTDRMDALEEAIKGYESDD